MRKDSCVRIGLMDSSGKLDPDLRAIKGRETVAIIFAIILLLVTLCLSCGDDSQRITRYLDLANRILSRLTSGLVELRDALSLPLEKQEGIGDKLARFRKSITQSRSKIDSFHTPESCMGLEDLLRRCIGEAVDVANVSGQFVDYLKNAGRIAREVSSLVSHIIGLKDDEAGYAVAVGFEDRANRLSAEARSVIVSGAFSPAHEILTAYTSELANAITKTAEKIRKRYYGSGTAGRWSQESAGGSPSVRTGILAELKAVAVKWQKRIEEIGALVETLKVSTGYQQENAEFDDAVLSTQAEIGKLEKEFKESRRKG